MTLHIATWTLSLFGARIKGARHRVKAGNARANEYAINPRDRQAFYQLIQELDDLREALDSDNGVRAFVLVLRCYHADVLNYEMVLEWLSELERVGVNPEEAYKSALERYAQKGG